MDLVPLNRGVLLLVGETTSGRVWWVERAGMALDVRGPDTEVYHDPAAFQATLGLKRPPVALDRYAVRALWVECDDDPQRTYLALQRLLDRAPP